VVGYGGTNQYRIWDPIKEDVVISRDVVFIEGKRIEETPATHFIVEPSTLPTIYDSITVLPRPPEYEERRRLLQRPKSPTPPPPEPEDEEPEEVDPQILLQQTDGPTQRASGRANKGTFTTTRFEDEEFTKGRKGPHVANVARKINPDDEEEPMTVQQAISHPTRGKQWEKAIKEEYDSLIKNHTWDIVRRPKNRQVVTNKFVLKHKKNEIAQIIRLKARLVARGFSQVYGVDYLDTYAPVVKLASIRILLAIAAIYGLEIHQMDVVTAFLAGELEEEIYMEQPEGFRVGKDEEDLVCLLRKSLYGLKQAPRVWNRKIRRFLESISFTPIYSDPCVYVNKTTGIIIAMWVDDLIIFGKNLSDVENLKTQLKAEYEMKDLGELNYFLGLQVHRDKARKLIHINQSGYNRTILERFSMADSNPVTTPLPGGSHLTKAKTTDVLTDQKEYQSVTIRTGFVYLYAHTLPLLL
jgi:hypothetical protein